MRLAYTAPVSSAHGRAGSAQGLTLRQSLGQQIASRTAAPTRPASPRQVAGRALLATIKQAYALLTTEQLEAWRTFAIAAKKADRIVPDHPSAWSAYLAVNTWRRLAIQTITDTPPPLLPTWTIRTLHALFMRTFPPNYFHITFTNFDLDPTTDWISLQIALPLPTAQRHATPSQRIYTKPISQRCLFHPTPVGATVQIITDLPLYADGTLCDAIITPYNSDFIPNKIRAYHGPLY